MTKEDILALEAGPELDTLAAEKLMGHPMPDFIPEDALNLYLAGTPIHYDSWTCVCRYDEGDTLKWIPDPYSTDISAASQILDKLKEEWSFIDLIWDADAWDIRLENYFNHRKSYLGKESGATYEQLPEAICKVALLVKAIGK